MLPTPLDASLAPSGILEALEVSRALRREWKKGMPLPERFFVSSLKRTGETCGLEWGWTVSEDPVRRLGAEVDDESEGGERQTAIEHGGDVDKRYGVKAIVIEVSLP
jgi:hypothetical protein